MREKPPTRTDVERWFEQDPKINYGIITGQRSGLVVVDIDRQSKWPRGLSLALTFMVESARGMHLYYRHEGRLKSKIFPWGDLVADGKYVVGPGSIHPDGTIYQALDEDAELSQIPDQLVRVLSEEPGRCTKNEYIHTEYTSAPDDTRAIEDYFRDPKIALQIIELCGQKVERIGRPFCCVWHDGDDKPSAALFQGPDSQVFYHDFHNIGGEGEWLLLPDVFARSVTGQRRILNAGERVAWGIRALDAIGAIQLPGLTFPELPEDVPVSVRKVWDGFCYLQRVREFYKPNQEGSPFSYEFAMSWCGIGSKTTVSSAINWLRDRGYLRVTPKPAGQRCQLFSVGSPIKDVDTEPARIEVGKLGDWLQGKASWPIPMVDRTVIAAERSV